MRATKAFPERPPASCPAPLLSPPAAAQYGQGHSRVVECPKNVVGRVIGKGGETIKSLQKQYSVSIQIDQTNNPCRVSRLAAAVAPAWGAAPERQARAVAGATLGAFRTRT